MTDALNLEQQLAELTEWRGPKPALWRAALRRTGGRRRLGRWVLTGAAAAAVVLITVGLVMPSLSRARPQVKIFEKYAAAGEVRRGYTAEKSMGDWSFGGGFAVGDVVRGERARAGVEIAGRENTPVSAGATVVGYEATRQIEQVAPVVAADQEPVERYVVRKAMLELGAADVRAVFLKAQQLISPARGEFIQESSVTGSENQLQANLTLRIAVDRLSDVLNELRGLGKVRSETSGGEDVTAQVVDIEARLRNERRIEQELLELLEKRSDAPLKEVLELRKSMGEVRQSIEQLTAQRQQLGRLVDLATVLVIIRPEDAPPPAAERSLAEFFKVRLHEAWRSGLFALAATLTGAVAVLVGGLFWWVLLAIVLLVVVRIVRRRRGAAAA